MDIWLTDIVKSTMKKVSKSLFNNQKHQEDNIQKVIKQVSEHFNPNFLTNLIDTKQYKLIAPVSEAFGRIYSKFETNKPEYINSFNKYLKAIKEAVETNFEVDNNYIDKIQDTISEVKKITSNEPMYDNLIETLIDEEEELEEQPAYAGSRVDYDKPSLDAIGSGEGHAAHGWGLYYAKNKDVASGYRDKFVPSEGYIITELKINGIDYIEYFSKFGWNKSTLANDIEYDIKLNVCKYVIEQKKRTIKQSMIKVLKAFYEDIDYYISRFAQGEEIKRLEENRVSIENIINNLSELPDSAFTYKITKGQIHKVELPEDEFLLDEDKDFDEQSKYIQNALTKLYTEKILKPEIVKRNKKMKLSQVSGTGKEIYDYISDEKGGKKNASLLLNQYGIKGITYDGRVDGRCYVIFNPDDVKVVDKLIKESKEITEAYTTDQKGNLIYYTSSPDIMMTIIKNKFPKGARVFYDRIKKLYVFSDVFNLIHVQMLNSIIMNTNLYSTEDWNKQYFNEKEQSWEEDYLKEQYLRANCIMFIIVPDDNFAEYTQGDGYTRGWFVKIDDMYAVCRNNEYHACRDEVPMFNDVRWSWTPTDYYLAKKEGLTESIEKLDGSYNTPIYVSNSVYEITNLIKSGNLGQGIRICYDKEKNLFMWADAYDYTHIDIFAYVCKMGYYPESFTVKKRLTNLTQEGYNYFNFHISQIKITRNMWADEDGYNMFNCFQVGKFMCYWRSEFAGDDSMDIRGTQFYDILSIDSPTMIGESFVKSPRSSTPIQYYTKSDSELEQIIDNKFNDVPVRVVYDFKKELYIFGNANDIIHTELLNNMAFYSNVSGYPSNNLGAQDYLHKHCASFKIIHTNDFKSFSRVDGYRYAYIGKIKTDWYVILRDSSYEIEAGYDVPDQLKRCSKVPLLKNVKLVHYDVRDFVNAENNPQKLVDEPEDMAVNEQVAYHGSITKNIKYFASEKIRRTDYGHGFYFTDSQGMAYRYSDNSKGKGSIYKCEIPDDEYLLDLNNEIKNQSEYVIKALVNLISEFNPVDEETIKEKGIATGDDIYTSLMNKYNLTFGGKEVMTEKLYKAGIKGLKYLDDDHDCHCFVIFNSKDIEILGEQDNIEEQVAYSGSPVDFDKHSNDFIKSGTGLMEYGWGLYFTADADEAKNYKNQALGRSQAYYNGELITQYNDMMVGGKPARELPEWSWNLENLLIKVYRNGKNFKKYLDETFEITFEKIRNTTKGTEEYQNLFKDLEDINEQMKLAKNITFGKGVVFKVEIPDDEYLMLADEEPSGQTPTVYKATYSLVKDKIITQKDWAQEGLQMYWALAEKLWLTDHKNNLGARSEDYKRASMKLRELGVKGIKFVSPFDDKTINYCIFSADDVKILDRDLTEQVNESVTDFNVNLQKAADLYIKFKLETYNCLEPDDAEYITFGIQETHKDLIQKAMEETGAKNEADLCWKINDCKNLGKYSKELVNAYALQIVEIEYNYIRTSFEESPYIYRAIASDKELNEFIKDLQEFGTGNCWADSIGYARQYYGEEGMKYTYILKGVVSDDNIDWIKTLALNAEDESEQEIRLLNDKPIKVIQIFENNSNKDEYVDLDLNTGSKYGYDHYQKYELDEQIVFHGSGIDFKKFKTKYIGNGIGNLRYGWGLYFTDAYDTANHFRNQNKRGEITHILYNNKLADNMYNGYLFDIISYNKGKIVNKNDLKRKLDYDIEKLEWRIENPNINRYIEDSRFKSIEEKIQILTNRLNKYKNIDISSYDPDLVKIIKDEGQLYTVEIPDDEYLLNCEETLSNQAEYIKRCLGDLLNKYNNLYGFELYNTIANQYNNKKEKENLWGDTYNELAYKKTSKYLYDLGIKGLINIEKNDKIYTIFNQKDVKIIKKDYDYNLNESIYHATMLKNGDMFEVHQNPTKKEFWDLLNRSEAKDLRGILGINEPILYVWDSYYGTHKQIFDSIIGKDWKESDYVGCWFRKNDMGVFGFSKFTSDIKEKYYGKEPEKPMSKDKLDKIIADDDLGLLKEEIVSAESNYDELYMVIYKNPTRKELSEDKYQQFRIIEDDNGNWYFGNAHDFVHQEMFETLKDEGVEFVDWTDYNIGFDVMLYDNQTNTFIYRADIYENTEEETIKEKQAVLDNFKDILAQRFGSTFGNYKVCVSNSEEPWLDYENAYFGQENQQINEDLEGYNRIAGFYWFDDGHWEMLKRKPEGTKELEPEDDIMDYCHLDTEGIFEDNKARFGIERLGRGTINCYIQAETKEKCLQAKKAIDKKFSDILINTYEIEWYNPKTNHFDFEQLDEAYVQHTTIDPKYNIEYNTDYIEFEPEMRFLDDYDVEWEVEAVKGENVFLRSKNNQVQVMTADDLNLEIDMEKWRCIWDERFYTKSDFERATGQKFPENITAR